MRHRNGATDATPPPGPSSPGPWAVAALCAGAVGLIVVIDLVLQARRWPVLVVGVLDEPAHLATAALLLAALLPSRARRLVPWALAGAVLIDLDHVPLYLWDALAAGAPGRPVTHSLCTVLVLAAVGLRAPRRLRTAFSGLALGVALHLVRDLATGPGAPLWWPAGPASVTVPHPAYLTLMALAAVLAVGRHLRTRRVA